MPERPIIFSTEMVRAILEGRKTQTRRVIKPQPEFTPPPKGFGSYKKEDYWGWGWRKNKNDWFCGVTQKQLTSDKGLLYPNRCPYAVGDRLWVRETFWYCCEGCKKAFYKADGFELGPNKVRIGGIECQVKNNKWKSSRFMPKWAARLWLEITEIRVERVGEITWQDIALEGIRGKHAVDTRETFVKLWDSLNAKRGFSWESNPWCWCISFRRTGL